MKVSLNWLKEYVDFEMDLESLKERFSTQSQEVDSAYRMVEATNLVVGYTKTCVKHPDADKLSVCEVDVKDEVLQIICGAPNVAAGQKVIVAKPGAVLPGNFKIKKAKLRGVESYGMICSLSELGIEEKYHHETGIHVLNEDAPVGEDVLKVLHFDDRIIELDLTPNRADLLSMHGVAYDVKAMLDAPLNIPIPRIETSSKSNPVKVSTQTPDCMSYYARVIDDIKIKESPVWMKARLVAAGIRPINNVVDITNYVMLETGQPLHAFDYDLFDAEAIIVRKAEPNEKFTTLDDKVRTLTEEDILITNGKKPVALGGVMGGADTEVHSNTTSILLESATFNPINVRRTSRRLDLRSESSMRFERGVDPNKTRYAIDRACELLIEHADATIRSSLQSFDHHDYQSKTVAITTDKINHILGSDFTSDYIQETLKRLSLEYNLTEETFTITLPTRRQDMETYQDVIEEIGRISGYNQLPNTLPSTVSKGRLSPYQTFKRDVRKTLNGLGLDEVVTYGLTSKSTLYDLTLETTEDYVKIANPLSENREVLSLTPLNGILDVVTYNTARKMQDVHIYEVGKKYTNQKETELLGIALTGLYHPHTWQNSQPADFFTLKGIINALFDKVGLSHVRYEKITMTNYHPHQTALIKSGDTVIGHIGKLHPKYAKAHDVNNVFLAEVNLEAVYALANSTPTYKRIQKYPSVSRDIALVVDKHILAQDILDAIAKETKGYLKDAFVFDVYEGEHVNPNEKSLAIRMVLEDQEKTLESKTVEDLVDKILKTLKDKYNATLR